jgi:hypothetical protein
MSAHPWRRHHTGARALVYSGNPSLSDPSCRLPIEFQCNGQTVRCGPVSETSMSLCSAPAARTCRGINQYRTRGGVPTLVPTTLCGCQVCAADSRCDCSQCTPERQKRNLIFVTSQYAACTVLYHKWRISIDIFGRRRGRRLATCHIAPRPLTERVPFTPNFSANTCAGQDCVGRKGGLHSPKVLHPDLTSMHYCT